MGSVPELFCLKIFKTPIVPGTKHIIMPNSMQLSPLSSEKYKIRNAAESCQVDSNNKFLYFNGYAEDIPRRFITISDIIPYPPNAECATSIGKLIYVDWL